MILDFKKTTLIIKTCKTPKVSNHHMCLVSEQGMEIVQTMNSDPGLAVGRIHIP